MLAVGRNAVLSAANPLLVFTTSARGTQVDPLQLSFRILSAVDDAKKLAPVQVFPGSGYHAVDLSADRCTTGGYANTGRHAAAYTVDPAEAPGLHYIEWKYQLPPQPDLAGVLVTQPVLTAQQPFEVLTSAPAIPPAPYYCLAADLRDEGLTTAMLSDAQLMLRIQRASVTIERLCGRFFEPRYLELQLNGNGAHMMLLDVPIVSVETLRFQTSPLFPSDLAVEPDFYRAYNRHLRGLRNPDDRNNPRIELFSASEDLAGVRPFSFSRLIFPRGQQNVKILGTFGFTDPDATPFGCTPEPIRRACQLLVVRDMRKLTDFDRREESQKRSRIKSERTRDQQYDLESARALGLYTGFTGDPEIDTMLAPFVRPPMFGAA